MHPSPFYILKRAQLNQITPLEPCVLTDQEITQLLGAIETTSRKEVQQVYQPLAHLIALDHQKKQQAIIAKQKLFDYTLPPTPYVLAIVGSVAAGKSTVARLMQALLTRPPFNYQVDIVPTDGFLYPNADLEKKGLMDKKGFPSSYRTFALIDFLSRLKSGQHPLMIPEYSHIIYDIVPHATQCIDAPNIVILEGLNILNTAPEQSTFVSDFIDNSLYIDVPEPIIHQWFRQRFMHYRKLATQDPSTFFYQFTQLSDSAALAMANDYWISINRVNLEQNILPYRHRARIILTKEASHATTALSIHRN